MPGILGSNIAGVVEKVGEDVTSFEVGERVFGLSKVDADNNNQAGLQQYAILSADATCKTPLNGFSDEQVVTLPTNLMTSAVALFTKPDGFGIPAPFSAPGMSFDYGMVTLIIVGGGTNVGKLAIQLARFAGIGKIIVIAGTANSNQLEPMGATHILNRRDTPEDIAKQVASITGNRGSTYLYDCANMQFDVAAAIVSVTNVARLRSLLPIEGGEIERLKNVDAAFINAMNTTLVSQVKDFWTLVPNWLKERKILPTEYQTIHGLERVKEIDAALDGYRNGARAGPQFVVRV